MLRRRPRRYATRNTKRAKTVTLVVTALVFLLLSLAISVTIGILLGKRAEEIGGANMGDGYSLSYEPYLSNGRTVEPVDAYAYEWGANVKPYISMEITDFSVKLRGADGGLAYLSEVGELKDFCAISDDVDLSAEVEYIHSCGGRVRAYFYVHAFGAENPALRELYKAYEIALVSEAARAGVDDIMLIGLEVDGGSIDELERYVSEMSKNTGDCALGVLVSSQLVLLTEQDIYYAARLRSVCDFLALDLRALPESADRVEEGAEEASLLEQTAERMEYYVSSYGMRAVLSKSNAALYDSAKSLGFESIQIVGE